MLFFDIFVQKYIFSGGTNVAGSINFQILCHITKIYIPIISQQALYMRTIINFLPWLQDNSVENIHHFPQNSINSQTAKLSSFSLTVSTR
jgi:hypothetical protein